jgi:hypothetical protein
MTWSCKKLEIRISLGFIYTMLDLFGSTKSFNLLLLLVRLLYSIGGIRNHFDFGCWTKIKSKIDKSRIAVEDNSFIIIMLSRTSRITKNLFVSTRIRCATTESRKV